MSLIGQGIAGGLVLGAANLVAKFPRQSLECGRAVHDSAVERAGGPTVPERREMIRLHQKGRQVIGIDGEGSIQRAELTRFIAKLAAR